MVTTPTPHVHPTTKPEKPDMTNSRAKGQRWETAVHNWGATIFGDQWQRRNNAGYEGDDYRITGLVSIEAKNQARLDLPAWHRQADTNAGDNHLPAVLHKRPRHTQVSDAWVTMTARDWAALIKVLQR